jgi:hypothetical protein
MSVGAGCGIEGGEMQGWQLTGNDEIYERVNNCKIDDTKFK